jgi:hypothetical protein
MVVDHGVSLAKKWYADVQISRKLSEVLLYLVPGETGSNRLLADYVVDNFMMEFTSR